MAGASFSVVETRRPDLRSPFPDRFSARLVGQRVDRVERRAKYLLAVLASGDMLLMHLGMSGSFRVATIDGEEMLADADDARQTTKHDHVVFVMSSGAVITFNDPRRFGSMTLVGAADRTRALAMLGPEPLAGTFDAAALARACKGRKVSLKAALLDQRIVAGLGNIYAAEALNRARLSPRRRASTLATRGGDPQPAAVRLAAAIKRVLSEAIASSLEWQRAGASAAADASSFPHRFRVYDREGGRCRNSGCPGRIRRIVQAGRSTFYCPVCQR